MIILILILNPQKIVNTSSDAASDSASEELPSTTVHVMIVGVVEDCTVAAVALAAGNILKPDLKEIVSPALS